MPARERNHPLRLLTGAVASSRPWTFLRSSQIVHRIRHSLSAKLAVAITLAALVLLLVFGIIVASQLRSSMFETRKDAILADASLRFSSAQSVFSSSTATSPDQVQESARGALASLKASAAGAGATNVALLRSEGSTPSLRINQIEDEQMRGLITPQMREAVAQGGAQWQSVGIRASDSDKVSPGILVGTQVQLPRAGTHELYILYSLAADQRQVDVVLRVLVLSALPIIVTLPIGVFALLHRLLLPVRLTVSAATKAAEGDLDVRVEVHGADEMAALGRAFNAMTSSLQDTISRYDELAKLQQRFVSDVSHELRTPLTTIRMAEDIVWDNREDLPAHARRSAELLHDQTERMEQMLADLLEISRYDAASALLDAEERDLRPIVTRVVEACAELAQRQGVPVEVVAPARAAAEIDERRIERVIRNLVVNAIEHADGTRVTITVATSATDVACRVRDRGVGMTQEVADHVFDRFYRADTARARTTGGTGLGLAIATEDVAIHGGRLQAYGEPGKGASFLMTLPKHAGDEIASRPLALWEDE
ncbi:MULTISPECIES: MtrAB system histidine kinase MtrB [Actinomycetaceae]|uniref:MtrAB system histidine kinase MtrB n=1 Tax=Actinomycetaceae TaxID=2049 RepID=UPI0003960D07|nr:MULTISPECIES: MtrAB system histidine kinase MtrB [Actinomycetaceae]ERH23723.1 ATPase/histidine kinase/DNA gyrase B/HSP90 domain protein [Actinomyces sp. oral taxon 172 str. F0311]MBF0959873.1 HAMP domain-containing histidine kinase [Actinomyces sp.]WLD78629.1 MtrAB system histidine kinase MtrB [Schaalia sp. HMT-172]